jgi:hypothetical protein
MLTFAPIERAQPAEEYRREARRLRASLSNDLPRLQRSLRQLSIREDENYNLRDRISNANLSEVRRVPLPICLTNSPADEYFAQRVRDEIQGGILRYSRRTALLRHARTLGIERFEASLIIACVQHSAQIRFPIDPVHNGDGPRRTERKWALVTLIAVVCATQAIIAAGLWQLFHS